MNYLYERVSYLRGLADGMELSEESKEGKLLLNMLDVLEDFADAINEVHDDVKDLDDYVETIDEDLAAVEDEVFEEIDTEEFNEDDIDFIEVKCPNCKEIIYLDENLLNNQDDETEVICPSCHEKIYIEENCDHDNCCCNDHNE
ncbi:hypothetical protein FQB35_06990 [Crassaminicella thermophila]|uniref:MJ0042 family finger-like domain-containing protein n=1 Tax=Crassaminicella thermophila TaxID=2599308 RepID=A0A5C0SGQ2_CRATE|nr:CD1247 N-terminal domain-containing protein [Crassaminicella thermophila]QEK12139.1 hypothetical protein FQB35_06990 [Crassaminicella thermophila]